jgi:sporulation protein YlmC with PRC-barrel domain
MLRSIKQLYGQRLGATDGEIGHVKDCYFDDQQRAVRYVVVDTGNWLPGRRVLLSPHAFAHPLPAKGAVLSVNLTRRQIEDSPAFDTHKPVSRQSEERYYRHHGWPFYWQGGGLWGMGGLPVLGRPVRTPSSKDAPAEPEASADPDPDPHLRSTLALAGYHLRASDGIVGHVCDFRFDDRTWTLQELVVKTGHRLSGSEVRIPAERVTRISWDDSTVFVDLTSAEVEHAPPEHPEPPPNRAGPEFISQPTVQPPSLSMKNTRPFPSPKLQSAPKPPVPVVAAKTAKKPSPGAKSKDLPEDRGTRQMKTSHSPQTLPLRR